MQYSENESRCWRKLPSPIPSLREMLWALSEFPLGTFLNCQQRLGTESCQKETRRDHLYVGISLSSTQLVQTILANASSTELLQDNFVYRVHRTTLVRTPVQDRSEYLMNYPLAIHYVQHSTDTSCFQILPPRLSRMLLFEYLFRFEP